MQQFFIKSSSHHNAERQEFGKVIEAEDKVEATIMAIQELFVDHFGSDPVPPPAEPLRRMIVEGKGPVNYEQIFEDYDTEEPFRVLIWYTKEDPDKKDGDGDGAGMGFTDDGTEDGLTHKGELRWVSVKEWTADEERKKDLTQKSKEELINMLLMAEASC